jgi:hypothetical protein
VRRISRGVRVMDARSSPTRAPVAYNMSLALGALAANGPANSKQQAANWVLYFIQQVCARRSVQAKAVGGDVAITFEGKRAPSIDVVVDGQSQIYRRRSGRCRKSPGVTRP